MDDDSRRVGKPQSGRTTGVFVDWFEVTNFSSSDFAFWARQPGVQAVVGDFDGGGKSDIALVGGPGWTTIPVAFSVGDGMFKVTNKTPFTQTCGRTGCSNKVPGNFASLAATPGVRVVAGDFDGGGKSEIALIGLPGRTSIPVAIAGGGGDFHQVDEDIPRDLLNILWAPSTILPGDFNGDGLADFAILGGDGSGWASIPIALSPATGRSNSSTSSGRMRTSSSTSRSLRAWLRVVQGWSPCPGTSTAMVEPISPLSGRTRPGRQFQWHFRPAKAHSESPTRGLRILIRKTRTLSSACLRQNGGCSGGLSTPTDAADGLRC